MGNKRDNPSSKGLIRAFLIGIPLLFISGVVLSGQCNVISSSQPKESASSKVSSASTSSSIKSSTESTISTTTTNTSDFKLAKKESLGFFNDIPSHTWIKMRDKVQSMSPNFNTYYLPWDISEAGKIGRRNTPGAFYQNHYEPDFICQHEGRIGRLGDGGKWICDPHRIAMQDECLVYSVGSNNDFSFEESVLKDIGPHCEIHTFDFGNFKEGAAKVGYRLHNGVNKTAVNYHQYGLGLDQPPKYKSLQTVVKEQGHENRVIDIFKIDCEGCEWETAKHWFEADVTLRQIQVELHKSNMETTPQFFDMMYDNDYVITHKEANIEWTNAQGTCIEYAFLKLSPDFHAGLKRMKGGTYRTTKPKVDQ